MTRELKRAYQELLLKYHPDKTGGKESDTFICVQVSIITNDISTLKSSVFKNQSQCRRPGKSLVM